MSNRQFNLQVFAEILCYILFSVLIAYLIISGKYLSYVTPRTRPYLIFSIVVMFFWIVFALKNLFKAQYKKHIAHCFVVLVPLLLLILPHGTYTSTSGNTYLANTAKLKAQNEQIYGQPSVPALDPNLPDDEYVAQTVFSGNISLHGYNKDAKTITISDDDYFLWISELITYPETFDGFTLRLKGFVYRDDSFANGTFMPSRMVMMCCVADAMPGGLVTYYSGSDALEDYSWVQVTGKAVLSETLNKDGFPQLVIQNVSVEPAQATDMFVYSQ